MNLDLLQLFGGAIWLLTGHHKIWQGIRVFSCVTNSLLLLP